MCVAHVENLARRTDKSAKVQFNIHEPDPFRACFAAKNRSDFSTAAWKRNFVVGNTISPRRHKKPQAVSSPRKIDLRDKLTQRNRAGLKMAGGTDRK